jgi:predicted esterase
VNRATTTLILVLAMHLCAAGAFAAAEIPWPDLPENDADLLIPAQEWPRESGPRGVMIYIRYPEGGLAAVGPDTGLFLSLHSWGSTGWGFTAPPKQLAERYNVVGISVDYLQSGPSDDSQPPYDFGYLQALDALRALHFVFDGLNKKGVAFAKDRIYCTGGSGGGNVTLMANKLAPRTFAVALDKCGMAKLSDDIAFNHQGGTRLNARYSPDPGSPRYLSKGAQLLRSPSHPAHLKAMKALGYVTKLLVVHGAEDDACPVEDAREMVANMKAAGIDVEPHWITEDLIDGKIFTNTGHGLGDPSLIVFHFGDKYFLPDSPDAVRRTGPTDFERGEDIRYETPDGAYVISYAAGSPVGRFERR